MSSLLRERGRAFNENDPRDAFAIAGSRRGVPPYTPDFGSTNLPAAREAASGSHQYRSPVVNWMLMLCRLPCSGGTPG